MARYALAVFGPSVTSSATAKTRKLHHILGEPRAFACIYHGNTILGTCVVTSPSHNPTTHHDIHQDRKDPRAPSIPNRISYHLCEPPLLLFLS